MRTPDGQIVELCPLRTDVILRGEAITTGPIRTLEGTWRIEAGEWR